MLFHDSAENGTGLGLVVSFLKLRQPQGQEATQGSSFLLQTCQLNFLQASGILSKMLADSAVS